MSSIEKAVARLEEQRRAAGEGPPTEARPAPEQLATVEKAVAARIVPPSAMPELPRVELDLAGMAGGGYITGDDPPGQVADEFRVIKRPIIRNASSRSTSRIELGNLVMVTSALPGEGKTFVAINLALSLAAEVGGRVLLVDADVAKPGFEQVMKVRHDTGLMDLLTGDRRTSIDDVIVQTNVANLAVMLAGTQHPRATEMLASEAMVDIVSELASRYSDGIVVFDSPPLLATTEARELAAHMGQIVMVVEAERTRQSAVTQALETLESCPTVLLVMNKAPRSRVGGYYKYYDHYRSQAKGSGAP